MSDTKEDSVFDIRFNLYAANVNSSILRSTRRGRLADKQRIEFSLKL